MADRFEAKARIPTKPLSYANKELAQENEILVDYEERQIYVYHNGEFHNITAKMEEVIQGVIDAMEKDPTILQNIFNKSEDGSIIFGDINVTLMNGDVITLKEGLSGVIDNVAQIKNDIKKLEESLGITRDELGQIQKVEITTTTIKESEEKQFVAKIDKEVWIGKADIFQMNATIKSGTSNWTSTNGAAPFIQEVAVPDILATDNPVVDIIMSETYDTAMTQLNNYAHIYKITTLDGKIRVYGIIPTTVDLNIQMKVDRSTNTIESLREYEEQKNQMESETTAENKTETMGAKVVLN